jgi:hypothetical protein
MYFSNRALSSDFVIRLQIPLLASAICFDSVGWELQLPILHQLGLALEFPRKQGGTYTLYSTSSYLLGLR